MAKLTFDIQKRNATAATLRRLQIAAVWLRMLGQIIGGDITNDRLWRGEKLKPLVKN